MNRGGSDDDDDRLQQQQQQQELGHAQDSYDDDYLLDKSKPVVGVLGGGQLGRMMGFAAHRLGIELIPLDPKGAESPAGQVCSRSLQGDFNAEDGEAIMQLAELADVITIEIEHVNVKAMRILEESGKVIVRPSSQCVATIQDKYEQHRAMQKVGIPVAEFARVENAEDVRNCVRQWGNKYPVILKSRFQAYDGKGNLVIKKDEDVENALQQLGGGANHEGKLYLEKMVDFTAELAMMVACKPDGEVLYYPLVETRQVNNICHTVFAPPTIDIPSKAQEQAKMIAKRAVGAVKGVGIFGVEMFLTTNGQVVFNEMAPRPHNSGHYTIEACYCDQFEQHLRAVLGYPLGDPDMRVRLAVMRNIIGGEITKTRNLVLNYPDRAPQLHLYGKEESRPGRKMGHVTFVTDSEYSLREFCHSFQIPYAGAKNESIQATLPFPTQFPSHNNGNESSQAANYGELVDGAHDDGASATRNQSKAKVNVKSLVSPIVGIIMGSDSDLPTMEPCRTVLEKLGVSSEMTIVSAHRTPDRMYNYAKTAYRRGIRVIVAGAGGAAHLPGMVAAISSVPVIGVPVKTSTLQGNDSLLSIVQMPRGIPVATVAIGNGLNAGLLAASILSVSDKNIHQRLQDYRAHAREEVEQKAEAMSATYSC